MTDQPDPTGYLSSTTNVHLYGAITAEPKYHASESADPGQNWQNYGYVTFCRSQGTCDLTIFVQDAKQALAISQAFAYLAAQFPVPAPDAAHECGTPAAGALDTGDYSVNLFVTQRDPADPESWVFRCAEGHPSAFPGMTDSHGWQSADYASEQDALIAAKDHARAMHDGGLPAALAERADAAERAAAEELAPSGPVSMAAAPRPAGGLIGTRVIRCDDDAPLPVYGVITAGTDSPEYVMVAWLPHNADAPGVALREALDELTPR